MTLSLGYLETNYTDDERSLWEIDKYRAFDIGESLAEDPNSEDSISFVLNQSRNWYVNLLDVIQRGSEMLTYGNKAIVYRDRPIEIIKQNENEARN